MYKIKVSGEQGNPYFCEEAKTLLDAKRIAQQSSCFGISYVVADSDNNPVAELVFWQNLNRWGHKWESI